MKRILAGVATLSAAAVLTACSAGGADGGTVAGGSPAPSVQSSPAPTAPAAPPSAFPAPSSPVTTGSQPAAPPKAKPVVDPKPAKPQAAAVPCASTVSACLDLSAHKAWLLRDGKVVYGPVPALPGSRSYPTPKGTFHVLSRERMHHSTEFHNAPMPYSVFFYPGDAFHTGSLSVPSHGCVHLSSGASQKFFNTLQVGDVVQIVP